MLYLLQVFLSGSKPEVYLGFQRLGLTDSKKVKKVEPMNHGLGGLCDVLDFGDFRIFLENVISIDSNRFQGQMWTEKLPRERL